MRCRQTRRTPRSLLPKATIGSTIKREGPECGAGRCFGSAMDEGCAGVHALIRKVTEGIGKMLAEGLAKTAQRGDKVSAVKAEIVAIEQHARNALGCAPPRTWSRRGSMARWILTCCAEYNGFVCHRSGVTFEPRLSAGEARNAASGRVSDTAGQ